MPLFTWKYSPQHFLVKFYITTPFTVYRLNYIAHEERSIFIVSADVIPLVDQNNISTKPAFITLHMEEYAALS